MNQEINNIRTIQSYKLISQFFENRYSQNLEDKIHTWLVSPDNSDEKEKAMRLQWDSINDMEDLSSRVEYEKIIKKLGFGKKKKTIRFFHYLPRVAAAIVPIIIFIGVYHLTKGEMKNKETQMAVITVPYGKHEEAKLHCGSEVWINSGSEIRYNEGLCDSARIINLKGEAYLSVMRQNDIPFIVHTEYLDVKVLGTQFNVSAYPEEELTVVTLNKGSIAIRTVDNRDFILKPNQQLVFNNETKEVIIQDIDAALAKDIADWTIGKISFNNETLKAIAVTLEREFDIDIDIDREVDLSKSYTFTIEQGEKLEEIIEIFRCLDNSLSYRLDNNKIYISNNKTE